MKVCTDSSILGAYATVEEATSILDIGTGTGLLALMAAQRSSAGITAIEIDAAAANQARENIAASAWANRIHLQNVSLQQFEEKNTLLFDVILCNPPFYTGSHQSPNQARNMAMHSLALTFDDIIRFTIKFLTPNGKLWMLLPPSESILFTDLAKDQLLFCHTTLSVFTSQPGKHIRTIQAFSKIPGETPCQQQLFIRNPNQTYTTEFQSLLKEYYLIF